MAKGVAGRQDDPGITREAAPARAERPGARRGVSILELWHPQGAEEFEAVAARWRVDVVNALVATVWRGYDRLAVELLTRVDVREADANVERDITKLLAGHISDVVDPYAPYRCHHEWTEVATRRRADASPPVYDIAFVLRENALAAWPLEAKVLRRPARVGEYVRDINEQFLTCRYAPFSAGGAMVAYLIEGEADRCLAAIGAALGTDLERTAFDAERPYRVSDHDRVPLHGIESPRRFRCHHLVMSMSKRGDSAGGAARERGAARCGGSSNRPRGARAPRRAASALPTGPAGATAGSDDGGQRS